MIKTLQWYAYLWFNMLKPRFRLVWLRMQNNIAERDACAHAAARNWARTAITANGSVIKVTGLEHIPMSGGVLFVSNHQSNFDIPILIGFVPRDKGFVAKAELMKVPVFSMWMKALGCVIINRSDARQSLQALNQAAVRLKEGHTLVIFPEGTRSSDGKLGRFKAGSLKLALNANVPIVPVTIKGSMNIMPKGTSLIRSADVEVIISAPVVAAQHPGKDIHAVTEMVREIIRHNLGE
ncbi:MAG: lysophospholipid acyltransferase family protein [Bacteroidales bacterium]